MPLPSYIDSMRCLDKSWIGNQVWREGITLIRGGWKHHPASKMWRGYELKNPIFTEFKGISMTNVTPFMNLS